MAILISNLQEGVPVDSELEILVEKTAQAVLAMEDCSEEAEVSILLTDDVYIQELNRDYRGQDQITDVLSFAQNEGEPMPEFGEEELLGDVVISLSTAIRQGEEYGHGFRREVAYLTAHGVLHLLGYDHQDEESQAVMREKEEVVMNSLGMPRN